MNNNIQDLINKYFEGETRLSEEKILRDYFQGDNIQEEHKAYADVFRFFEAEAQESFDFQPDLSFTQKSRSKLRNMMPRIIGLAASLVILLAVAFNVMNGAYNDTMYKNKYTELTTPEQADEALAITLDALGFMSHKMEKGTNSIGHMKNLEKTAVFNFNKN